MRAMTLPANGWKPRWYQMRAWRALQGGCKHMELVYHRRAGKDDLALHWTAVAVQMRVATYWHMLPSATQARRAIWNAVNPHTGIRRIDEVFPVALRQNTNEQEMFIRFQNGGTWQVVGSDNYNSMVGAPPVGIVYSEWALANPAARAYLRPILAENGGWQIFISTPRGKNHCYKTYAAGVTKPDVFAELLTVADTGMLSEEQKEAELSEYIDTYGHDQGRALFEQEYMCSFEAAILGAYYGGELKAARESGRVTSVPHDASLDVYCAMDIGRTDDTAIWWYQVVGGQLRIIDAMSEAGRDPDWIMGRMLGREVRIDLVDREIRINRGATIPEAAHRRAYRYGGVGLPHDARAKTFGAQGKSVHELFGSVFGGAVHIVPSLSLQDGIGAARRAINVAVFDGHRCGDGLDALEQYQRDWQPDRQRFGDKPRHDWCSHYADGWRYLAIDWRSTPKQPKPPKDTSPKPADGRFRLNDMWEKRVRGGKRI